MSGAADRVALEGLRLLVREWIREILAEERPATPVAAEGYIGASEAARRAGVKAAAVRGWIKSGRLPATKVERVRGFKIKPSDLDAFLSGGVSTDAPPLHSPPVDFTQERALRLATSIPRGQK